MGSIDCVKNKIEVVIRKSPVPEDPIHAKNTLEWLLKLKPDADDALKISALGHDIERAIEHRKVKRKDYKNYDEFKRAHALNSAKILEEIMNECNVRKELTEDVFYLVSHHEKGGDDRVNVLMYADSISFFQVNLPYYFVRNGLEETLRRCLWGFKKLPYHLRRIVAEFDYGDENLETIIMNCIDTIRI